MLIDSPTLAPADARAILDASRRQPALHAGVALILLAGLRPAEVQALRVTDYAPGDVPCLTAGAPRAPRTIRIAPTAARAVDAYLATRGPDPEGYLVPELAATRLVQLVRGAAGRAGVSAGVHDLWRAAVAAALDDGTPVHHIEAYFGMGGSRPRTGPRASPAAGYDAGIAAALEATFC